MLSSQQSQSETLGHITLPTGSLPCIRCRNIFLFLWQAASVAIIIISLDIASHTSSQRQDSSSILHFNGNFDFSRLWACKVFQPVPLRQKGGLPGAVFFRVCFTASILLVFRGGLDLAAGSTQVHTHPTSKMQAEIGMFVEESEIWLKIHVCVLPCSPPSFTLTANPTESTGRRKLLWIG